MHALAVKILVVNFHTIHLLFSLTERRLEGCPSVTLTTNLEKAYCYSQISQNHSDVTYRYVHEKEAQRMLANIH